MPAQFVRLLTVAVLAMCLGACASSGNSAPRWQTLDVTLDVDRLEATTVPAEPVSMLLADARTTVPFAFEIPAWSPAGFALQDEVEVLLPSGTSQYAAIMLTWQNVDEDSLTLKIASGENALPGSRLGGQLANHVRVSWAKNEVTYTLSAERGVVSEDDLKRMAASIP